METKYKQEFIYVSYTPYARSRKVILLFPWECRKHHVSCAGVRLWPAMWGQVWDVLFVASGQCSQTLDFGAFWISDFQIWDAPPVSKSSIVSFWLPE